MNRHLFLPRFRVVSLVSLLWGTIGAIAPTPLRAEVPLTRADIESIYNDVDFISEGQAARRATLNDWLNLGDAVRTFDNARTELRFNDGSLARVGEQATFWFVPNTRNFRLSNGTALFLIPPERGPSNIETPSAVTGIQGTALVVRHIPFQCDEATLARSIPWEECPGRTIVMVLTESPKGPVEVTTANGNTEALAAGNMAVIEGNSIQVLEFNLELFYQTSPLVEGLNLDNPNFEGEGAPTDPVRQETWDGMRSQEGFEGSYLLNPDIISVDADLSLTTSWLLPPDASEDTFTGDAVANNGATSVSSVSNQNRQSGSLMSSRVTSAMSNVDPARSALPAGIIDPVTTARSTGGTGSQASGGGSMGAVTPPRSPSQPVVSSPGGGNRPPQTTSQAPPTSSGGNRPTTGSPSVNPNPPASNPPVSNPPSTSPEPGNSPVEQPNPDPVEPPTDATPPETPANPPIEQPNPGPVTPPVEQPNPGPVTPPVEQPNPGPVTPPVEQPNPGPVTPPVEQPNPGPVTPPVEQPNPGPVTPPVDQRPPTPPSDVFNPPGNPNPTPSPEPFNPPGNPTPSPDARPFNPPGNPMIPSPSSPNIPESRPLVPVIQLSPAPAPGGGSQFVTPPAEVNAPFPVLTDPIPNNTPGDATTLPNPVTPGVVGGGERPNPPIPAEPSPAEPVTPEPVTPVETPAPIDQGPPVETPAPIDQGPPAETPAPIDQGPPVEGLPPATGESDVPPGTS